MNQEPLTPYPTRPYLTLPDPTLPHPTLPYRTVPHLTKPDLTIPYSPNHIDESNILLSLHTVKAPPVIAITTANKQNQE